MSSTMPHICKEAKASNSAVAFDANAWKPVRDDRMQHLLDRRDCLGREGRRSNFVDNPEFLVYHWSGTGRRVRSAHRRTGDQRAHQHWR